MGNDNAVLVVGIGVLALLAYVIFGKNGATDQAGAAGKWVAENIINPFKANLENNPVRIKYLAQQGQKEAELTGQKYYLDTLNVPATPAGFSTSNVTWKLANGVSLGLPSSITPAEFCRANPNSPICKPGAGIVPLTDPQSPIPAVKEYNEWSNTGVD